MEKKSQIFINLLESLKIIKNTEKAYIFIQKMMSIKATLILVNTSMVKGMVME